MGIDKVYSCLIHALVTLLMYDTKNGLHNYVLTG